MSTNGGPPGGAPNGLNGLPSSHRLTTGFYDISIEGSAGDSDGVEGVAPPSRPSSPESGTTPRVLLGPRVAEATSRQDLLRSIPTAQPPFFGSITAYTHAPLPPRGGLHPGASNGASGANGHATNGLTPSSPLVSLHSAYYFPTLCFFIRAFLLRLCWQLLSSFSIPTSLLHLHSLVTIASLYFSTLRSSPASATQITLKVVLQIVLPLSFLLLSSSPVQTEALCCMADHAFPIAQYFALKRVCTLFPLHI